MGPTFIRQIFCIGQVLNRYLSVYVESVVQCTVTVCNIRVEDFLSGATEDGFSVGGKILPRQEVWEWGSGQINTRKSLNASVKGLCLCFYFRLCF